MSKPQSIYIDNNEPKLNINKSFAAQYNQLFIDTQDINLSIRERALLFFEDIIGNDEVKEQMYRALLKEHNIINILLCGPPATSKTMLCKVIEDKCNNVLYYDAASGSTGAGLIELLRSNPNARILIIDEIAEMNKQDLKVIRGLLNDGRVSKTLQSRLINFRMRNLKVFATTNNPQKIQQDKPLKSRFQMYSIDGYDNDEFVKVLSFCLKKQRIITKDELIKELAFAMLHYDIKNIRLALSICSLVDEKNDSMEDIQRIIENYITTTAQDINVNYNEEEV